MPRSAISSLPGCVRRTPCRAVCPAAAHRWPARQTSLADPDADGYGRGSCALYLVRHAKAGSGIAGTAPTSSVPSPRRGGRRRRPSPAWLVERPVPRILSSPYVRCIETVEPLAEKLGLEVEISRRPGRGPPLRPALELLATLPDHGVLCSHGDLIPDVIEALARRGTVVDGAPDWRKGAPGSDPRERRRFVRGTAVPPPTPTQLTGGGSLRRQSASAPLLSRSRSGHACTLMYQMIQPMNGSRNHRPQQRADRALPAVALVHLLDLVRDREHDRPAEMKIPSSRPATRRARRRCTASGRRGCGRRTRRTRSRR